MATRLYSDLARYYDLIYHWKPYAREAGRLHEILAREGVADGADLCDVACGTGSHIAELARWYRVRGRDLNAGMVEEARRKLPDVSLSVADMAETPLSPPADAMLCLFSAIGYVYPEERLVRAVHNFAAGLAPGGVLIVEPWVEAAVFQPGTPMLQTHETADLKLCRALVTRRDGDFAVLEFHWLVAGAGEPRVRHEVEEHRLWLVPHDHLIELLEGAGLSTRVEPDALNTDRPLLVARRD